MAMIEVEGIKLGCREQGAGEAVLFLHGVGSDKDVWDEQLRYFSSRYRAVSLDYPGYGESDPAPHDLDREQIARYIFGALDALMIEEAHVVGLSMGGVIALEMWRKQPHRLLSLTLADTFSKHPEGDVILERSLHAAATLSMREFAARRVDAALQPAAAPALKKVFVENMARIDPRSYRWASRAVWTADYGADLSRIETPTLILVGEYDTITPLSLSQELQRYIRHSHLRVIPAAGHLSNLENPTLFNDAIAEFFDSLNSNTSSAIPND